jgi:response regulator RpfG family c-di-GMP phosphodiesterase
MSPSKRRKSTILLVCDKPEVRRDIEGILSGDEAFDVRCLPNSADAMKLASETEVDLIICHGDAYDSCMGYCGEAGKQNDRLLSPSFLLLSDGLRPADIARSLEKGADDFIEKQMCGEILLAKVRSLISKNCLRQDLWKKEKRLEETNSLLERNFKELTAILLKMLEVRVPGTSDRAEAAKAIADFCTERLGFRDDKRKQVIFASLLHEIGKVGLPDEAACKHYCTLPVSLLHVFQQHVTVGSMIISAVTGYREAAEAVYHQLENYDGSGFPDELMGDEIPVGARVLRAIVFYEELRAEGVSRNGIIERLRSAMHSILDQRIANLLIEFVLDREPQEKTNEFKLPVDELAPGMVIAEDVFAASGVKLLPKGVRLQEKTLALLIERNAIDPIIGGVYVLSNSNAHL